MQLTANAKAVILNYLKDGQREMALQYISRTFHTSHYDSQKLLEAVEQEFSHELRNESKKFDSEACSGCLSKILKVISILLAFFAVGIFVLGYFFIQLFGDQWNTRQVPVVVIGTKPDYSNYVNLIFTYRDGDQIKIDTGSISYDTAAFHVGDSTHEFASTLGLGFDKETLELLEERERTFYYAGAGVLTISLIFLAVSSVFNVRPPSKETAGRYNR